MGQDWSLTRWPHPSVLLATRNPTGCSLGNVSTAYWNFFDEPEFQVTEEHDPHFPTGPRCLCHVGASLIRVEIYSPTWLHCPDHPDVSLLGFRFRLRGGAPMWPGSSSSAGQCFSKMFKWSALSLFCSRVRRFLRQYHEEWNVKGRNGFLCEPSLGVIHCVYSSSLGLTPLPYAGTAHPSSVHKSLLTDRRDTPLIHHHAVLYVSVIQTLDVQTSPDCVMSVQNTAETRTLTKNNRNDFQPSEMKASSRKWRALMLQNSRQPLYSFIYQEFGFCMILPNDSDSYLCETIN